MKIPKWSALRPVEKLLGLWKGREYLRYYEIRDMARERFPELKNVSDYAIMRYLKKLVSRGKLVKKFDPETRKSYYYIRSSVEAEKFASISPLVEKEINSHVKMPMRIEFPSIAPFPIMKLLIGDISEDDPLYLTQVGFRRALYEGLEKSASGSIFSDLDLPPAKVNPYPLAETYVHVLTELLNDKLRKYDQYTKSLANDLEKRLRDRISQVFWKKVPTGEERKLMSERFLKGELLPEETRAILQSAKESIEAEKKVVSRLMDMLNFQFHVVITFDGEELVKTLREYEKKLDILLREHADYIFKLIKKRILRMCQERLSSDRQE